MFDNDRADDPAEAVLSHAMSRPEIVRSEEVLTVSTESVPYARARLQKVIVTESQTFTVQVRREEVRLVTESLPGGTSPHAPADAGERSDVEMILHEERVTVTTEIVPTERVRMVRYTVTGSQSVTADIRKEKLELQTQGESIQHDI